jgi:hypothetical protein
MVVPLGFEPKLTLSKSAVLPLHHGTVAGVFVKANRPFCESFLFRGGVFSFFTTKDMKFFYSFS